MMLPPINLINVIGRLNADITRTDKRRRQLLQWLRCRLTVLASVARPVTALTIT